MCPPPVTQRKCPLDLWRSRAFSPVSLLHISASNRHPMNSHLYLRLFHLFLENTFDIFVFGNIHIKCKNLFFLTTCISGDKLLAFGFFPLKRHIFIKASTEVVSNLPSIVLSPPWWWHWYKKKIDKFTHFWKIIKN